MNFSIVFDNSGDALDFITLDSSRTEVLNYYVDNLNQLNSNSFQCLMDSTLTDQSVNNLHKSIVSANAFIEDLTGKPFEEYNSTGYLNQATLNQLHADWVNLHAYQYDVQEKLQSTNVKTVELANKLRQEVSDDIKIISLSSVLSRLGIDDIYGQVNDNIHRLEEKFEHIRYGTTQWIQFKNIFPKSLINNDICNFRIPFHHLGRTLFHKYQFFDTNLEYNDENSFNELVGFVDINLSRTQTIPLSKEYIAWCKEHGKEPSGLYLNIGNLKNLEQNLNDYRLVVYRNIRNCNNFSIKLNKG